MPPDLRRGGAADLLGLPDVGRGGLNDEGFRLGAGFEFGGAISMIQNGLFLNQSCFLVFAARSLWEEYMAGSQK